MAKIVQAAYYGRVELLRVAIGAQRWGVYDADTDTVNIHAAAKPGDEDLLDFAATQTLLSGGTVYALAAAQMPSAMSVVAVFRY